MTKQPLLPWVVLKFGGTSVSTGSNWRNIAGIVSAEGNVLGMMPHPERALDATLGSTDSVPLFASILESMLVKVKA
jgi:phosphoribosylformylglycinamidine synthase